MATRRSSGGVHEPQRERGRWTRGKRRKKERKKEIRKERRTRKERESLRERGTDNGKASTSDKVTKGGVECCEREIEGGGEREL